MRQGLFLWWSKWPALSPFLASKGLFNSNFFFPPGSPSMSQGGFLQSAQEPGASRQVACSPAEPVCPLAMSLAVPALARICPWTGPLARAGHAYACPSRGLSWRRLEHAPRLAFCPWFQCLGFCGGSFLGHTKELDAGSALSGDRFCVCIQRCSPWLVRVNGHAFESLHARLPSCVDRPKAYSPWILQRVFAQPRSPLHHRWRACEPSSSFPSPPSSPEVPLK